MLFVVLSLVATASTSLDVDGDGYSAATGDCDDSDVTIHPGATDLCNGIDDDCDPTSRDGIGIDLWSDLDDDYFGAGDPVSGCAAQDGNSGYWLDGDPPTLAVVGYVTNDADCNDFNANISPSETEVCDELDNDCDDVVDDAVEGGSLFYDDGDGDGFGVGEGLYACAPPDAGWVTAGGDCDDLDASASPGAEEVDGDGVDNDCDGLVDAGGSTPADTGPTDDDDKGEGGCGCDGTGGLGALQMVVPLVLLRRRRPLPAR